MGLFDYLLRTQQNSVVDILVRWIGMTNRVGEITNDGFVQ